MKDVLTQWYGVFGWLWCLPYTILSCFLVGPLLLIGQIKIARRYGWIVEVVTVEDSLAERFLFANWAGVSFGAWVWYKSRYANSKATVEHERQHCRQSFRSGLFAPLVYAFFSLAIYFFVPTQHAYFNNPLEEEARVVAGQEKAMNWMEWTKGDRWIWW